MDREGALAAAARARDGYAGARLYREIQALEHAQILDRAREGLLESDALDEALTHSGGPPQAPRWAIRREAEAAAVAAEAIAAATTKRVSGKRTRTGTSMR